MNCRKCGARHITRRSAGIFVCQHCGVQPNLQTHDRFGNILRDPASVLKEFTNETLPD